MEDSSSQRRFRDEIGKSVRLPIEGMKTAVVTVTGYCSTERFNLIKLISKAGGNYVGRMSSSITHLVCWKYEGIKFQIAIKHKMFIVNHQWIEDCVKAGKRLPEDPYTRQCGYEVGPLKFDASLISDLTRCPNLHNDRKEPSELHATQSLRSREKRTSASPELSHGDRRRRLVRRSASKQPLVISSDSEEEITGQEAFHELYHNGAIPNIPDPSDKINLNATEGLVSLETSNSDSAEPSHRFRRRRLVKKNKPKETLNISQSRERSIRLDDLQEPSTSLAVSVHSSPENEGRLSDLHAGGPTSYECGQNRTESTQDVPTEDVNDVPASDDPSLTVMAASSDHIDDKNEDRNDIEPVAVLPKPTELSCVICLTNFSTTRGVLPCGHRFCYSCIISWVDRMAAMQKASTCPLCKAVISSITKVDDAVSSDQKIYSQTVPDDDSRVERIHILSGAETSSIHSHVHFFYGAETPSIPSHSTGSPVCCHCNRREPVDLLERCTLCPFRSIHTYCLDPPLFPWTCGNCRDLQRLYQYIR